MAWHNQGTVSVQTGSASVTGAGTGWLAGGRPGDAFVDQEGRIYEVLNIASDTSLTLTRPYMGPTAAGIRYELAPLQGYLKENADKLAVITQLVGGLPLRVQALEEGGLVKGANLSDLNDAAVARMNLGLKGLAQKDMSELGLKTGAFANVVGAMSDGAIIERGSNANGEYVRFADGTQICLGIAVLPAAPLNVDNGAAANFPAEFAVAPRVLVTTSKQLGSGAASSIGMVLMNGTWLRTITTGFSILTYHYRYATDASIEFNWMATGRWK